MKKTFILRGEEGIFEKGPTPEGLRRFRKILYRYYRKEGRDLPWRNTENPYHILVSEVMLQQTQVERVLTKYNQFISAFPDYSSLGKASLKDVLAVWQGMGYNRRAVALKKTAEIIVSKFAGETPTRLEDLISLPGIGHATASAVVAFAFNEPAVFIETNIRRVFIHFFFRKGDRVSDAEILPLVERTLDRKNPREWYFALMDYGAMLKKSVPNPNKKSIHHQRQAPFEGSMRQLRGRVLKLLLDNPGATERDISLFLKVDPDNVKECLHQLAREGFIVKSGRRYQIV
jgi:A/G-specific adenine glycosylase